MLLSSAISWAVLRLAPQTRWKRVVTLAGQKFDASTARHGAYWGWLPERVANS